MTLLQVQCSSASSDIKFPTPFAISSGTIPSRSGHFFRPNRGIEKIALNHRILDIVVKEIAEKTLGRRLERVRGSGGDVLLDFRLPEKQFVFLSANPRFARIHLVRGKQSSLPVSDTPSQFVLSLRKHIAGLLLTSAECSPNDRIVYFSFGESAKRTSFTLIGQLTGKSSNLFLTDGQNIIIASARERENLPAIGSTYFPPYAPESFKSENRNDIFPIDLSSFSTVSDAVADYYSQRLAEAEFTRLAAQARSRIRSKLEKTMRLVENLKTDLSEHGEAEHWKRYGDLLLAQISNARRTKSGYLVKDYFDDLLPEIEIPAAEGDSPAEAAEKYFRKYSKAKNAARILKDKLALLAEEISALEKESEKIETAIAEKDIIALRGENPPVITANTARKKQKKQMPGCRRFLSSDGFEILVGKKDKDNDFLTFRIAASRDIWLHAADYPGSHVVIRTGGKPEIPNRTLIEAAQAAAFYSKAGGQAKAAVNYTQRKNVHKRKGSPAGQVSLSDFKTILVEPKITIQPIR
jgi:predicted ribosome quality control (RQC) complex YloA/Tae2 family protein